MRLLRRLAALPALAALVAPLAAQVVVSPAPRGWIGVSVGVETTVSGRTTRTVTRVVDVLPGSPAAEAGVRVGDILVSVNGRDWDQDFLHVTESLRPGDPVRLLVHRDGRDREIHLTAGTRPRSTMTTTSSWSVTVTADSVVDRLYQAMDSLRIRITEGDENTFRVLSREMRGDSLTWTTEPGRTMVVRTREGEPGHVVSVRPFAEPSEGLPLVPEVRAPFGFYVFRGQAYDSLRMEMERLNREIRALRSEQAARTRELARAARGENARIDRMDPELRRLDDELAALRDRAETLRRSMEETTHATAVEPQRVTLAGISPPEGLEETAVLRPLSPYLLGQNRVAGAEVIDLQPELAEYFQVEGGVLVVDAPPGTPAERSGLQPGDVLTHVGGDPVRSIADLRRGLARSPAELPVTVVRKGRTLEVLLRR